MPTGVCGSATRFPVVIAQFLALRNYTLFYNGLRGVMKNDRILLANLLQSSRSTFSRGSLPSNWLQVLDTAERTQIYQRVRHQFHAVVSLLDAFKAEQQPLELVLPGKGPLNPQA